MDAPPNIFADERYELDPQELQQRLARGEAQLVDVREPHEWEAGRIPGARHIELERLAWNATSIDRSRPVVFNCRLGMRAAMATQAFRAVGFDAYNLGGGIAAWQRAGLPLDPQDGHVAEH